MRNFIRNERKVILLLVYLVIFLTGFFVFQFQVFAIQPDTEGYLQVSNNLSRTGTFHSEKTGNVDLYRTPGYPIFILVIREMIGSEPISILIVQIVLVGLQSVLLYRASTILWNQKTAFWAVLFSLLAPATMFGVFSVLTETLFTFFLVMAFFFSAVFIHKRKIIAVFFGGVALGTAAIIRPIGMPLILLWGVCLYFFETNKSTKERIKTTAVWIVAGALVIFPWMIRNLVVWDTFTLSPIAIWNLGHYQVPAVLSDALGISLDEARSLVPVTRRGNKPGEIIDYLQILWRYPFSFLKSHLTGDMLVLIDPFLSFWVSAAGQENITFGFSDLFMQGSLMDGVRYFFDIFFQQASPVGIFGPIFSTGYLLWIYYWNLKTLLLLIRNKINGRNVIRMILFVISYLVLIPGVVGNGRFRIPTEPFLAMVASVGFTSSIFSRNKVEVAEK